MTSQFSPRTFTLAVVAFATALSGCSSDSVADDADVSDMLAAYAENETKEWIEATVTIDGATYRQVGLRLKGDPSQLPSGGPGRGQGGGFGGGGFGARANPLVERFHDTEAFEALYQDKLTELRAELFEGGRGEAILDQWTAVLREQASDLVDVETIEAEAETVRAALKR